MEKKKIGKSIIVPAAGLTVFLLIRLLFFSPAGFDTLTEDALNLFSGKGVFAGMIKPESGILRCYIPVIAALLSKVTSLHPGLFIKLVFPIMTGSAMFFLYAFLIGKWEKERAYIISAGVVALVFLIFTPAWSPRFLFLFLIIPFFGFVMTSKKNPMWVILCILLTILILSDAGAGTAISGNLRVFDLLKCHAVTNGHAADKEMLEISEQLCEGGESIVLMGDPVAMGELPEITLQITVPIIIKEAGRPSAPTGVTEDAVKYREIAKDLYINDYEDDKLIQHGVALSCNALVIRKNDTPEEERLGYFSDFGYVKTGETEHYILLKNS